MANILDDICEGGPVLSAEMARPKSVSKATVQQAATPKRQRVLAVRQGPVRGCRWRDSMHNMRDRKVPDCNGPERMRGLRSMPRGSGAN